jgi:ATP-dependent RNA helicase MRH4, mitochondrial
LKAKEGEDVEEFKRARRKKDDEDGPRERPMFKMLKMRKALEGPSMTTREIMRSKLEDVHTFQQFGLEPLVEEALLKDILGDLATISPTPIQKLAIPALLGKDPALNKKKLFQNSKFESYLLAAETGSGKTLAYLLPILDYLKKQEAIVKAEEERKKAEQANNRLFGDIEPPEVDDKNGKPKAVVIVPTSELVNQVGAVAKKLSYIAKFRSALVSRDVSGKVIRNRLFSQPLDLLVCTPALLQIFCEEDKGFLQNCTHIAVDEADSLFDRSFAPITNTIIDAAPNLKQLVLCSATIPRSLDNRLRTAFPEIHRIVTPNVHAVPRRVQLSIVDSDAEPYRGNKPLACADVLHNISKDGSEAGFVKKAIVFVNERETTKLLCDYLRSKGIDAVELERDTPDRASSKVLEFFTGPKTPIDESLEKKNQMKVLVTTDIASRGIDTKHVKNVLLFDVPHTTIDFIHRLGRAGRMGRRGRAIIFTDKKTDKAWVKEIKTSMHMGSSLC